MRSRYDVAILGASHNGLMAASARNTTGPRCGWFQPSSAKLYLQLEGAWYPDALLPFEIAAATPLELPDYSGPLREQKVHFFLPYNLMWPSDMRNWEKSAYRTEHLRISEAFRKHLAEKGWTKTQYQIYYNHKEDYNFFPWNLDEPTRDKDLEALGSVMPQLRGESNWNG